jgi:putative heme iron utilization protein
MSDTDRFDPVASARRILREARTGALATLLPADGAPFASLVTVATDPAGAPLLLLSGLAVHTANLAADPRASLLLEGRMLGDPLQGGRISINGVMRRLPRAEDAAARRRFLARQPEAAGYAEFPDFDLWRMTPEAAHLVAGFGRIVRIAAADLLVDAVADEADLIAALQRSEAFAAAAPGWRVVGVDGDGVDLGRDGAGGLELRRLAVPGGLAAGDLSALAAALAKDIATKLFER